MDARPPLSGQSSQSEEEADRLDTWKLIGAYLHRDIRTAQRWERTEHLPVHRAANAKRGSVFAFRSEIDAWWKARGPFFPLEEKEPAPAIHLPTARPESPKYRRWLLQGSLVLAVVLALAAGKLVLLPLLAPANSPMTRKITVAVSSFQTIPSDQDDRALAAGIMKEVTNALGNSAEFHVIPVAGPGQVQADLPSLDQVMERYHPQALVEGSITRSGDNVEVAVQVIDVSTGRKLSTDQFDRSLRGNHALGSEIGQLIFNSVRNSLLPPDSAP